MPFLTEELYQRLRPRTSTSPPSICVSSYPEKVSLPLPHARSLTVLSCPLVMSWLLHLPPYTSSLSSPSPLPSSFPPLPSSPPPLLPSSFLPHPPQLTFHNPELDQRVKLTQEVVRLIRSMRQDYLPAKAKPEVYLVCKTDEASDILHQFVDVVTTLSQCSK